MRSVNPFDMDKFVHNTAYSYTLAYNIYRKKSQKLKACRSSGEIFYIKELF
jgi:hypothetical protein